LFLLKKLFYCCPFSFYFWLKIKPVETEKIVYKDKIINLTDKEKREYKSLIINTLLNTGSSSRFSSSIYKSNIPKILEDI
jgi:hypothetical protein